MNEKMDFTKIFYAAIIYGFWVILIGYFVEELAPYAAIIAALGAGIYVGQKTKPITGMASGFIAGLIGGVATGILSISLPNVAGVPISVSVTNYISPVITSIAPSASLFSLTALTVIGLFFGLVGGLLGSLRQLRPVFLFFAMFLIFIFLGAIDNAAWNILTPNWTWEMSFSHVLTNEVDLWVAVVFSFIVTILTYLMNLHKGDKS
jgi:hypothetical protein